jgi:hypothetical protein
MSDVEMTGYIVYEGLTAMQHENFYSVFEKFLREVRPNRIVEIGTAGGGLTLALQNIIKSLDLSCSVRTYDIHSRPEYETLRNNGIDSKVENIFDENYIFKTDNEVIDFIQSPGTTLVLCDGGYKITEFNQLSNYLKRDDYIMAHDYSKSNTYFKENIRNKIWNWCEIIEDDITAACFLNELKPVMEDEFQSIVWVCKTKKKELDPSYSRTKRKTIDVKPYVPKTIGKMPNFTLVTGLWDIKRGNLTDFNRSFDHYLENFGKLLSLDFNMHIYVPSELVPFVEARRSNLNTRITVKELEDIKIGFDFFDDVQRIRTMDSWRTRASWLENSPQAKLEYYNPIVMSKFFFVHDSSIRNLLNTDYFFWIDGGLTNTVGLSYLEKMSSLEDYMKSIRNKMLFLSFPYQNDNEVHGFESSKFAEFCEVDKTEYVCRGGFFGGHKDRIRKFNSEYYLKLNNTLKLDYMGTEENIHTILTYLNPNETHRFELENNGLVYPFFESLDKVEKRTVSNAELIPWDKKKTAEDLKTSLYVLTFNSPQQFEALIKSYEKNDPDFIHRTRKILIDNSTETNTYPLYSKMCEEYGFEHIKKEVNLGICGARQFIAEHFNESDSEYYIFLEDDMTLHDPTDELCNQGHRRHIDSLYLKSLEIIHRNKYDYLKLSYSEFYGNNGTQWAWYNVPQSIREQYFPDKPQLPEQGLDPDPPKIEVVQEKRYKDVKYYEGNYYYCNWPLWFSRIGNKKVFLDTKWAHPYEQTWMSHVFQMQKQGKIKAAVLALTPIFHHRFDFYTAEERKES